MDLFGYSFESILYTAFLGCFWGLIYTLGYSLESVYTVHSSVSPIPTPLIIVLYVYYLRKE